MSIVASLILFGILLHFYLKLKSELKDTKQELLLLVKKVDSRCLLAMDRDQLKEFVAKNPEQAKGALLDIMEKVNEPG